MTYITPAAYQQWQNHTGARGVILCRIDFTKPSAKTLYLATSAPGLTGEHATPDGRTWEPVLEWTGPIDAPGSPGEPGPAPATWSFRIARRKFGYQAPGKTVLDALVDYEWQGAAVTAWVWFRGLASFADASPVFVAGEIDSVNADPYGVTVQCKQPITFREDLPDGELTRDAYPGIPDQAIGSFPPALIGNRAADPFPVPYASPYTGKNLHHRAGGGTLLSPGVVVDSGRDSGKLKVLFAGHQLETFQDSAAGCDLFMRGGGQFPSVLTLGTGFTLANDPTGASMSVDLDKLRAIAAVVPIDVRGISTCLNPRNALEILNPDTYASLDEVVGQGLLELILPNVGSLGPWEAVTLAVAYSTTSTSLVSLYRNHYNGATGTPQALPFTGSLDTVSIVEVPWDGSLIGSWDFGGDGNTFLKDLRFGFGSPSTANRARVFWCALLVKYTPNLNVIIPGLAGQSQGATYDAQGRVFGDQTKNQPAFTRQPFVPTVRGKSELVADFFGNFRGAKDDGSGSSSGNANALVELNPDVAQLILERWAGVPGALIERDPLEYGSFVAARTQALNFDGNVTKVGAVLKRGRAMGALQALARDTRSVWFINRFTGKHSWVQWDPDPGVANYPRKLTRGDILERRLEVLRPVKADIRNRVSVAYGWDEHLGTFRHSTKMASGRSIGGHEQRGARDQALTIAAGVNDKLDWREEQFLNVGYGVTSGQNRLQVASSAAYAIGMTVIEPNRVNFPNPVTITGIPDGTHIDVSQPATVTITYPNNAVTIERRRSCILNPGNYTPTTIQQEVRTRMKAVSTSLEIKVDWAFSVVAGFNDVIPVTLSAVQYTVSLTPGVYRPRAFAKMVQDALQTYVPGTVWTVTYQADRKLKISAPAVFSFDWLRSAPHQLQSASNLMGFDFHAATSSFTSQTAARARIGESFIIGRAHSTDFALLIATGANVASSAWSTLGYRTTIDQAGARAYNAEFRRSNREALAAASELEHGPSDELPVEALWLNTGEAGADLRDGLLEWNVEQRNRLKFATCRFPDLERFMVFETDADLDGLMPYQRQGSNGSFGGRLWMVYKSRQMMGGPGGEQMLFQEHEAVELGAVGSFAPVTPPTPPPAALCIGVWRDDRGANTSVYASALQGNGTLASGWTANGANMSLVSAGGLGATVMPASCPDGAGGCYLAVPNAVGGGVIDMRVVRLTGTGAVAAGWSAGGVVIRTGAAGVAWRPKIVPDGSGGCILAWADTRTGGVERVFAQRVNAAGVVQWTANGVMLGNDSASIVFPLHLMPDGAGGAIAVWGWTSPSVVTAAQRVNGSGALQWGTGGAALQVATGVAGCDLCPDGAGGALFLIGLATVKRYTAAGALFAGWGAGGVNVAVSGFPVGSTGLIASDGAGGAIVAWPDNRSSTRGVYARRVKGDATLDWTAGGVPVGTGYSNVIATIDANMFDALPDGGGGIVLAYSRQVTGITNAEDLYVQRLSNVGVRLWGNDGVNLANAANNSTSASLAQDASGGYYCVWEDLRGVTRDIYAQRIEPGGAVMWTANGVALAIAGGDQRDPAATQSALI